MTEQNYDEFYWHLTLGHSDFTDKLFNDHLKSIVTYIDTHRHEISQNLRSAYGQLQSSLRLEHQIHPASIRKVINQFVKLGFVESGLAGYHEATKPFLAEPDLQKKMTLFSKIVYSNASFERTVTKQSDIQEINFFIDTLIAHGGTLTKEEAKALMTIDIAKLGTNYADEETVRHAVVRVSKSKFNRRKYNQMNFLWGLLGKLDDLTTTNSNIYFSSDPRLEVIQSEMELPKRARDSYLQRLYKNLLVEEAKQHYGAVVCMVEKLGYPGLIASHIKPYIVSSEAEQFDANNGLLLSRNLDFLFDQGYISFDDDGAIMISETKQLSDELKDQLRPLSLDSVLLNGERVAYLAYHQSHVFIA